MLVVLLMVFGPFAQGMDIQKENPVGSVDPYEVEPPATIAQPDTRELLSNIDGFFTENLGQKGEGAGRFYCQGSPLSVAFGKGWVAYDYRPSDSDQASLFRACFVGANPIEPRGLEPLHHKNNYFIGNDPDKWVVGASNYRRVEYPGLYDGIDLTFTISQGMLKYEYLLQPGYDPSVIQVNYEGVLGLHIDSASGDLIIDTPVGALRDTAPISYIEKPDGRENVLSSLQLEDASTIGYSVAHIGYEYTLVIDPGLDFSTYIGGSGREYTSSVCIDEDDNILIAGSTNSTDFPTTTGAYDTTWNNESDGFAVKLIDNGTKLGFATYVGGDGFCYCGDIEVDHQGNVLIAGRTDSSDFPTTEGSFQPSFGGIGDAFILVLDENGSAVEYCTYFGGSGGDSAHGLEIGPNGDVYICGKTVSTDLPAVSGHYDSTFNGGTDCFVARLDHNLSEAVYATYIGGSGIDFSNYDQMTDTLFVDDDGCAYVASLTRSNDFPTTNGAISTSLKGEIDGFVFKLNKDGNHLLGSTLLGGSAYDSASTVIVDSLGLIYVVGETASTDFPTTTGAYDTGLSGTRDGFLVIINTSFKKLEYGTFIGGSKRDLGYYIGIDGFGDPWIIGRTISDDFPTTDDCYDDTMNLWDLFLTSIDIETDSLKYSTYLGGSGREVSAPSLDIHNTSLAVTGYTKSTDFPTTDGAFDTTYNGGIDAIIACFYLDPLNGTPPTPPRNLSAESGMRSIRLSWEPPEHNGGLRTRGYSVFRGTSEDSLQPWGTVGPSIIAATDVSCECGRTYYYAVKAFNFMGDSNLSNIANSTTYGTPTEPLNLELTPGCGTVLITWQQPLDLGGVRLMGYRLFRSISSDPYELLSVLGNETEYLDNGLQNGKEHNYYLLAFNALGNGTRSAIITTMPVGPPSEPRYLQITAGDSKVELEWRAPENDGGSSVIGYNVLRGLTESSLEVHETVDYFHITLIDTVLTNGVTYHYAIRALNAIGEGPRSVIVSATPVGLPGIPVGFQVSPDDGQVKLSWSAPDSDGGTPVIRYEVFRGPTETTLESIGITGADVTDHTDDGLMNGKILYYAVCAVNKVGNGPWTEVAPITPLALPDPPGNLVALAGNGLVTISWTRPMYNGGAKVTHYNIYCGISDDALDLLIKEPGSVFIHDDVNVVDGTTYFYAVAAFTAAGEGPRSIVASATPYGPPGIPIDLVAIPGNMEVRLTWSPPDNDGASPIEGYVVMRGESTASLREIAQLGDVTSYLDTGVTNGITYLYAIAAINEAGPGDYTETIPATPVKPTTAPGKVTTLVTEAKGTKVTLQWSKPQDDGGSPVTGYVILRGLTKDSLEQVAEVGPAVTTWSEDGLERGTTYYYSVAAKNDVGEGEAILAREVKVPPKADESPGFEVLAVMLALLIVVPILTRRR